MPFAQYGKKRSSRWGYSSITNADDPLKRSISNAETRIEDAGYNVEDANQRNWFEKATNLPQGQNWFFDTLDILGRPGQAVMNAIDKGNKENLIDAAWKGFSGQERVRGTDLADSLGIENNIAKTIVGTGLEIGLDPLTYVPGGVIAKGLKGTSKLASTPLKTGYNALENASPKLKQIREEVIEPKITGTKDRLGYMFNPDYKATETLTGGKSDDLMKVFRQTENDRRFLTEEYGNKLIDSAKITGLNAGDKVGRELERGLKQYDEAGEVLPRAQRPVNTDPKIKQAADNLMQSNQEIRNLAAVNGINVSELEGYMTHILSKEERARRKADKATNLDNKFLGTNQPNKSILQQRKLTGSVEDVNEQLGRKFFEPNAYFASAIGQKRLIDFVQSVSFRKQVLNNTDFARKYEPGMEIPKNGVVIDSNNYSFIKDSGDYLEGVSQDIGGKYVVTKAAKEKLDRYKSIAADENSKAFLKAFDTAQSFWKRAALFSIPYHLRNDLGAKFNNWIGGMSMGDITKYSAIADKDVYKAVINGKEVPLYREFRQQGLGSSSQSAVEFARRGEDFEKTIERSVKKQSKLDGTLKGRAKAELSELKNPLNAFETSRDFGDFIDQTNRFAAYRWAREKKGMSANEAAKFVKETQFDYTNITNFERDFMTRAVPFYRWMRNNIPYQINQFIKDPRKYSYTNKLRLNAQENAGIDEENVPDWMKESFALPVYSDGQGKGKMLGLNLPLSDLTRLSQPGKTALDAVSPLIKSPAELALNRNFFYNSPIERFEGQEKQFQLPGGAEFGIPVKTAYALEQATGQVGRGLASYLQKPQDVDQDKKFRMPSLGISSILKDFDAEKSTEYEMREKLRQLQDYINYIEQQTGERPRSVNEINREETATKGFSRFLN
jgi:hypothetical protein